MFDLETRTRNFVGEYQRRASDIINSSDTIFLDNIFPNPVRRLNTLMSQKNGSDVVRGYGTTINFWREQLNDNPENILIHWDVYLQACKGYTKLEREASCLRTKGNFNGDFSNSVKNFQNSFFSLLKDSRFNRFSLSAKENEVYGGYFELVKELTKTYQAKKEDHKDDNFTDEKLVASAIYTSDVEDKSCTVLTSDRDISKIVAVYNLACNQGLVQNERSSVTVSYPMRLDKSPITNTIDSVVYSGVSL
jgi:hypothetical protein